MISKKTCEELNEIQAEIIAEMEFFEELINEILKITDKPKNFKKNDLSEYLQNLLKNRKEESEG
jgi:hypothetical protein